MRRLIATLLVALPLAGGAARAEDTVKIGYIDPLSGGGASIGEIGLKHYQFLADELNAKGGLLGKKVEIIPFDNKTNPQESLIQAQKAIDAGKLDAFLVAIDRAAILETVRTGTSGIGRGERILRV